VIADIVDVAWMVARALEAVGAEYYIGGSVASSLQAAARTINDIDFVIAMRPETVAAFARELGPDFAVER
jgi:hypothetical protein